MSRTLNQIVSRVCPEGLEMGRAKSGDRDSAADGSGLSAGFGPVVTPAEAQVSPVGGRILDYEPHQRYALRMMALYLEEFLAGPHPNLGREGDVCPFVSKALANGTIYMTVSAVSTVSAAEKALAKMTSVFRRLRPSSPVGLDPAVGAELLKALLLLFPDTPVERAPDVIDRLQERLKTRFISNGLMIGQFHPACPEPGLHNPTFRPLQAPVPCLAIRHITRNDAVFMMGQPEHQQAYVSIFGEEGERRILVLRQGSV